MSSPIQEPQRPAKLKSAGLLSVPVFAMLVIAVACGGGGTETATGLSGGVGATSAGSGPTQAGQPAGSEEGTGEPAGSGEGAGGTSSGATPAGTAATISEIIDADTFDVRIDGSVERVRLIGIDAPEAGTCAGEAATAWARDQLDVGESVTLVADPAIPNRGKYDRLLRYVRYDGGTDYGSAFLRAGWDSAQIYNDPAHHLADKYRSLDAQNTRTVPACTTPVNPAPTQHHDDDGARGGVVSEDGHTGGSNGDSGGGVGAAPGDRDCAPPADGVDGPVPVAPGDPDGLDSDGDGVGCEG